MHYYYLPHVTCNHGVEHWCDRCSTPSSDKINHYKKRCQNCRAIQTIHISVKGVICFKTSFNL